ncbi:unnamed protein product [Effrenium voratum]|nr:unnamed protein product [Effrenium voratum]
MGFPKDKVLECLRVAGNNEQQAVEYLLGGLPRERSRSPRRSSAEEDAAEAPEEDAAGEEPGRQVSESDQAAVSRLMALGFGQQQALEAYVACDRQEELAANFLFEEG